LIINNLLVGYPSLTAALPKECIEHSDKDRVQGVQGSRGQGVEEPRVQGALGFESSRSQTIDTVARTLIALWSLPLTPSEAVHCMVHGTVLLEPHPYHP